MAHRVLVTDKLAEEGLAQLRAEPGIEVVVEHEAGAGRGRAPSGAGGGRRDRDPVGDAVDRGGAGGSIAAQGDRAAPGWAWTTST